MAADPAILRISPAPGNCELSVCSARSHYRDDNRRSLPGPAPAYTGPRLDNPGGEAGILRRRTFLQAATGAALASAALVSAALARAKGVAGRSVLFMGGTGFIGPHMVRALLRAGCEVTLFNRGRSNPHLFPGLRRIRGDRTTADIEQLAGTRWDVIVDTSCYLPRAVDLLMAAVDRDALQQYVLISSVLAYRDFSRPGLREDAALARMDEDPQSEDVSRYYGPLKAQCEQRAELALPGRVTRLRCGQIVGPGDSADQFIYWPQRIATGAEVLAPGSGDGLLQLIDARDLADWVVHCIDAGLTGPYNTTGPPGRYTFGDMLQLCRQRLNPRAQLTWVPADFLARQGIAARTDLPLWVPPDAPDAGAWQIDTSLASAHGLAQRPLGDTIVAAHDWFQTLSPQRRGTLKAGISARRQAQVLAAWHAAQGA